MPQGRQRVLPFDSGADLHPEVHTLATAAMELFEKRLTTGLTSGIVPFLASESMQRSVEELRQLIERLVDRLPTEMRKKMGKLSSLKKAELEQLWLHLDYLVREHENALAARMAEEENEEGEGQENGEN